MKNLLFLFVVALTLGACSVVPIGAFEENAIPRAPDYSQASSWAALPDVSDEADHFPKGSPENQTSAPADVFFIHPTTYTGKKGDILWNGPVDNPGLNKRTDESTIKYQSSVFNESGKVYAPRYRQAHYEAYTSKHREDARRAFELAYSDVRNAFLYYLEHYNQGRPIIIATHSQGAQHGRQLVREFFDGKPLQSQLVVAYLVGMPVSSDLYQVLRPCQTPEETGCYCSWRTYRKGHYPRWFALGTGGARIVSTNPLNWLTDSSYAPKTMHKGAVLKNFDKIYPKVSDAQNNGGLLWISKPRFPGSFLLMRKNYHIGDYNLFYMNVRENVALRVRTFLEK